MQFFASQCRTHRDATVSQKVLSKILYDKTVDCCWVVQVIFSLMIAPATRITYGVQHYDFETKNMTKKDIIFVLPLPRLFFSGGCDIPFQKH